MNQFVVTIDLNGNLYCKPGRVIDLQAATTTYYNVGNGAVVTDLRSEFGIRFTSDDRQFFVGGGGFAINSAGTVTGTLAPVGKFIQTAQYEWTDQFGHVVTFDPTTGDASMVDVNATEVATFSDATATIAPVGTFTATTYGEDTYNAGSAFTLTTTYEGGGVFADAEVILQPVTATLAPLGTFTPTGTWGEWESATTPDWILSINPDKSVILLDPSDEIVAQGTSLSGNRPDSILTSTSYGETTYNSGDTFTATAGEFTRQPIAGYVYIELELSSGSLVGVTGPFFAATLPANSSTLEVMPIAYSNGSGTIIQIHEGPIHWR